MNQFSDLLLNGFVVCFFFCVTYLLIKNALLIATVLLKIKGMLSFKINDNTEKSGATRSQQDTSEQIVTNDSSVIWPDNEVPASLLAQNTDWSEYDSPTYVRRGIVIH